MADKGHRIGGYIGHYNLAEWWLSQFSGQERELIEKVYARQVALDRADPREYERIHNTTWETFQPSRRNVLGLATGTYEQNAWWPESPTHFIETTERALIRAGFDDFARAFIEAVLLIEGIPILDRHFFWNGTMRTYYRLRDKHPDALRMAIFACEQMIAIAPEAIEAFGDRDRQELQRNPNYYRKGGLHMPEHHGFQQLAIIREKEGNLQEAIRLSEEAMAQGWSGDWERRIERYRLKHRKACPGVPST